MEKLNNNCVFCGIIRGDEPADIIHETEEFICFLSKPPVTEGHTLVVPKTHVQYMRELESQGIYELIEETQRIVKEEYDPDATNIGINNGPEAGQTIPHLHWHIIPRYDGDMDDPSGGVRGVIPSEQKY